MSKYFRSCTCLYDGRIGHATCDWTVGDSPEEIEYDYTCVVCGVTVPMCEGGTLWDDAVALVEKGESNLGCCGECAERLNRRHGDDTLPMADAVGILYDVNVSRFGKLSLTRWSERRKRPRKESP